MPNQAGNQLKTPTRKRQTLFQVLDASKVHTIRRLRTLKPGEQMTVYRGNLENDLLACQARTAHDPGSPTCQHLLSLLRDEMFRLEACGVIHMRKEELPHVSARPDVSARCTKQYTYIATAKEARITWWEPHK